MGHSLGTFIKYYKIMSTMEHHSNIVPWQLQQQRKNIRLRVIPMSDDGALLLDEYEKLFSEKTKLVSVMHVSNVLGTVNPVKEIIRIAHSHGVPVMIDGAQSIPHMRVDVQDLDCEFLAFSGHKVYAPTGVGVLYGKEEWLDRLPPYQGGGEMIERVSFDHTTFERPPLKFEAGTPDYIATNGLAKAIDYVSAIGMENIQAYEHDLTDYALQQLREIEGMHIYGHGKDMEADAVISFNVADIRNHQHIINQRGQHSCICFNQFTEFGFRIIIAVLIQDNLRKSHDRIQRCTYLVAHGVDKFGFHPFAFSCFLMKDEELHFHQFLLFPIIVEVDTGSNG